MIRIYSDILDYCRELLFLFVCYVILLLAVERSEENTKSLHRKCGLLFRYFHTNTLGPKAINVYITIYVKIIMFIFNALYWPREGCARVIIRHAHRV